MLVQKGSGYLLRVQILCASSVHIFFVWWFALPKANSHECPCYASLQKCVAVDAADAADAVDAVDAADAADAADAVDAVDAADVDAVGDVDAADVAAGVGETEGFGLRCRQPVPTALVRASVLDLSLRNRHNNGTKTEPDALALINQNSQLALFRLQIL